MHVPRGTYRLREPGLPLYWRHSVGVRSPLVVVFIVMACPVSLSENYRVAWQMGGHRAIAMLGFQYACRILNNLVEEDISESSPKENAKKPRGFIRPLHLRQHTTCHTPRCLDWFAQPETNS
ncbi:uncharacterized protein EI97DRAFT_184995 [Westerdykella ornata]|uniref:Uncharacterized protein n=1 Tax=Westerdykella ornata TaxID=318751 RepID=A0A6A6JU26_WESOR|nr:uncharacterized protein EI97DRAFT_184995 [Westerdykella ornata]KAF2279734.1 hypothetical protein EI97DRAFT_184995 [Westerdykella ornata]